MKNCILSFIALLFCQFSFGQKFHLKAGVGMSSLNWYENQVTANFSIHLNYQKPNSPVLFFGELKTLGNTEDSKVNPANYDFIPQSSQSYPTLDVNQLSSYYRGGSMEIGLQMHQGKKLKNIHISPEISLYSISLARKISTEKTNYVEEEKYALHGLSGGIGFYFPGKIKFNVKSKLFLPLITNFTLYGRYIGVPYETSNQEIDLCYRNVAEITFKKFNVVLEYDTYLLGKSENLKSKTIPASTNTIASLYLNYLF